MRNLIRSAVLAAAALVPLSSLAQEGSPELRQEFEVLFQRLLDDPSDRAANNRFVEVALLLDDTEAAIGALERLLFYNPNDPEINYRLGELYLSIEAYVFAQTFFETVLTLPNASPDLRERASTGLAAAQEGLEGSPISGFAQVGLRYQTNATVGPDEIVDTTDRTFLETPDWNSFAFLALAYREPIDGAVLEADLTAYYADQFKIDRLDLGFGQFEAGPRVILHSGESGSLSFKPYGLVEGVLLGDDPYQRALGGGAALRANFANTVSIEPYFEYRDRNYFNSDDYPRATEQTGDFLSYVVDTDTRFGEAVNLSARGGLNQNDARVEDNSYDEYFIDMSLRVEFDPFRAAQADGQAQGQGGSDTWTFTPFAGVSWTEYDAPDPDIDPLTLREDLRWRAGARLQVPVVSLFGLGLQVQYTKNDSNLSRFDYDNLQVTAGPTARF